MESAFHVTTRTSGTTTETDVKAVLKHMFSTRIAEDVFAQTIYHSILELNVCNVYNQATGTPIREDAYNVLTNKFTIDSKGIAHHAHKPLPFSKTINVTHALNVHITIKPK